MEHEAALRGLVALGLGVLLLLLVHARSARPASYAGSCTRQAIMATTADAWRNQRIVYTAPKAVAAVTPMRPDVDYASL